MEKLYKKVDYVEYMNFFQHRKIENISKSECVFLEDSFSDAHIYYRTLDSQTYIEMIQLDTDDQMIIKKYQDEWWGIQINISNGPSSYYILDTLDGLKDKDNTLIHLLI